MRDACATPDLLSLEKALIQILDALPKAEHEELLPLRQSLGRVLSRSIQSAINVPSFRNSYMDGYALHSADHGEELLTLIGTSWAGKPFTGKVRRGECVRIFTGAYVPKYCDCVVMQENVQRKGDNIHIITSPNQHENIRNIADDTSEGQEILTQGTLLEAAEIALLASCGIAKITVFKRLTVGFFSTGDELVSIGSQLQLGQIYDSNRYAIHALLTEAGVTAIDMGVIPDTPEAVEKALLAASQHCDAIITSGGVSVGEADFITDVLDKIGHINLWKIAIKPGKPFVFGSIDKTFFFGLPGNPVSVAISFQQILLPAFKKMMGYKKEYSPLTLQATLAQTIYKQPGRTEFQRGIAENINDTLVVNSTGNQGSHILSSMSKANCLIILEQGSGDIEKGQTVNIQLLGNSL